MDKKSIIFIGPISGFYSPNVVCKGLIRALTLSDIFVYAGDTSWDGSQDHTIHHYASQQHNIEWLDRYDMSDIILKGEVANAYGNICVVINPNSIEAPFFGLQEQGIKIAGMHVGDVDTFPARIRLIMEKEDLIITSSSWCQQVIKGMGITKPVMVLNHGISKELVDRSLVHEPDPSDPDYPFIFLHFCASVFYPERKSTGQVFAAFERIVNANCNVQMRVIFGRKTRQTKKIVESVSDATLKRMDVVYHESSRPLVEIADMYRRCHALLAPSRAEGFGIMPLEARASGTPVIQTLCTGHADHLAKGERPSDFGIQVVEHGPMQPAWGGLGQAPEVTADAIYDAMISFMDRYPWLSCAVFDKAARVQERWRWETVTEPLIRWIKEA